jgi:hypothetical protein
VEGHWHGDVHRGVVHEQHCNVYFRYLEIVVGSLAVVTGGLEGSQKQDIDGA